MFERLTQFDNCETQKKYRRPSVPTSVMVVRSKLNSKLIQLELEWFILTQMITLRPVGRKWPTHLPKTLYFSDLQIPIMTLSLFALVIKPIWSYGIELWGCASKSNIVIMHRSQSKILRAISHNKCTPVCNKSYAPHRLQHPLRNWRHPWKNQ